MIAVFEGPIELPTCVCMLVLLARQTIGWIKNRRYVARHRIVAPTEGEKERQSILSAEMEEAQNKGRYYKYQHRKYRVDLKKKREIQEK